MHACIGEGGGNPLQCSCLENPRDRGAWDSPGKSIGRVVLQVGEVSGIMTDLFTDAWDYFKVRHPVLKDSQLVLETIPEFQEKAVLTLVSATTIVEGGAHDVIQKDTSPTIK